MKARIWKWYVNYTVFFIPLIILIPISVLIKFGFRNVICIFSCFSLSLIYFLFLMYRNSWVYETRIRVDYDIRRQLISYEEMVAKFWIWDINKLMKTKDEHNPYF
jgi:hypothetical protein